MMIYHENMNASSDTFSEIDENDISICIVHRDAMISDATCA